MPFFCVFSLQKCTGRRDGDKKQGKYSRTAAASDENNLKSAPIYAVNERKHETTQKIQKTEALLRFAGLLQMITNTQALAWCSHLHDSPTAEQEQHKRNAKKKTPLHKSPPLSHTMQQAKQVFLHSHHHHHRERENEIMVASVLPNGWKELAGLSAMLLCVRRV